MKRHSTQAFDNKNASEDAQRMKIMTNNAKYTLMAHDNRCLIVKTSEGGNPHVVAECYLEQTAALICQLLSDAADTNLILENTQKGNNEYVR